MSVDGEQKRLKLLFFIRLEYLVAKVKSDMDKLEAKLSDAELTVEGNALSSLMPMIFVSGWCLNLWLENDIRISGLQTNNSQQWKPRIAENLLHQWIFPTSGRQVIVGLLWCDFFCPLNKGSSTQARYCSLQRQRQVEMNRSGQDKMNGTCRFVLSSQSKLSSPC